MKSVAGRSGNVILTSADVGLSNVLNGLQVLNGGGTPTISAGIFTNRPAAGNIGYLFFTTDTGTIYRDNGVSWVSMRPSVTGDVSIPQGSSVSTLATINSNVGTFNNVIVNAKGLITAASNISYLTGNEVISISGDGTGSGTNSISLSLSNTGITPGTYKSLIIDSKGRATAGTNPTTLVGYGIIDAVNISALSVSNGVATLDATGRLLNSQIPTSLLGALVYQGTWNATNNSPTLISGVGTKGDYYIVSITGTTSLDGISSWAVGDQVIFNGTVWNKVIGSPANVSSVAGRTGAITLSISDITGAAIDNSVVHLSGNETITGIKTFSSNIIGNLTGNISGNANTVTTNANLSGDVTSIGNVSTLSSISSAGTYRSISIDTKGRVISGTNPTTIAEYGITDANPAYTGDVTKTINGTVLILASVGAPGTYKSVTVDTKGRVTSGTNPTTLAGYGITDANPAYTGDITKAINDTTLLLSTIGTPGTYQSVTVDTKGRVTSGTNPNTIAGYGIVDANPAYTGDVSKTFNGTVLTLSTIGTSGTYKSVTTDTKGRVISGTNPTTLAGYGIIDAVLLSSLAATNGVATLDASGKVPTSQLPASGASVYKGTWNAGTNNPIILSGNGVTGNYYNINIAGSTSIDGISSWAVGDQIIFNGTVWQKIAAPSVSVTSVAGRIGAITLSATDITGVAIDSNVVHSSGNETVTGSKTFSSIITANISGNANTVTTNANLFGDITSVGNNTSLPSIGTAGTYRSISTDAKGRVISGTNPSTLAGYGITDAVTSVAGRIGAISLSASDITGLPIPRTITGTGEQVVVTNGNGISGNPVISLSSNIVFTGSSGITIPNGSIAEQPDTSTANPGMLRFNTSSQLFEGYSSFWDSIETSNTTAVKYQPISSSLSALINANTGIISKIGSSIWATRTLVQPSAGFTITNSTGVTGNPIFTLSNDLGAIEALNTNGLLARTGNDTWISRNITGSSSITISNGDGVSGNPVITLSDNPILPGTGSTQIPIGTTAQRTVGPNSGAIRYNSTLDKYEFYQSGQWTTAVNTVSGVVPAQMTQLLSGQVPAISGTTSIPFDNNVPSSANGMLLFSRSITMTTASARVLFSFPFWLDSSTTATIIMQVFRSPFWGYQIVNVGGQKISTSTTNLVSGTTYTATITIDGVAKPISILGSTVSTYGTLVNVLQNQIGTAGMVILAGGNIKILSITSTTSSSVSITAGTLFASPLSNFVSILTAVSGATPGCIISLPNTSTSKGLSASISIVDVPGAGTFTYSVRVGTTTGTFYVNSNNSGFNFAGFNTTSYSLMEVI